MRFVEGKADLEDPINEQQDQLILSWLLSSMSLKLLLRCVLVSHTRSRVLSLRQRLYQLNNGFKLVVEYVSEITKLVDALTLASDKTSNNDIVLFALAGPKEDYDTFVQNVMTKESDVTFMQLQSMLLD